MAFDCGVHEGRSAILHHDEKAIERRAGGVTVIYAINILHYAGM
jgi:hypothetical protein